jgi:hypothetical protein
MLRVRRSLHIRCSSLPSWVSSLSNRELARNNRMTIQSDTDFRASLIHVNRPPDMIPPSIPFVTRVLPSKDKTALLAKERVFLRELCRSLVKGRFVGTPVPKHSDLIEELTNLHVIPRAHG